MSEKKFKYLVADTTAFINKVQLETYAENVLTVPDVIDEVKNRRQIRRLVVLPYDLQVREPDSECLAFVTKFAKKTGDFFSLSAIDLKVIALTYQLEKEYCGTSHLRAEPILTKVIASEKKPEVFKNGTQFNFFDVKDSKESKTTTEVNIETNNNNKETDNMKLEDKDLSLPHLENENDDCDAREMINDESAEQFLEECFKKLECNDTNTTQCDSDTDKCEEESDDNDENSGSDSDESSWITPSNIAKVKKQFEGGAEEITNITVACMSTDFAIQNVLKQINLNIAALDGRVIKHLRTYILRCYACFKTTSVITKMFCPNCGSKTLKRVAVSLDENGQQIIHINTRRPLTTKYKNQSLPRFKGGKHSCNPILTEDQPMPKQMPSRVAKTKTCALAEDYTAGISPFVWRDVDSKSALLRTKGNLKQWAKNSEYEEFRRKKHFNRLVK